MSWHHGSRVGMALAALAAWPALALAQQQQYGETPPNTYVTWGTNNRTVPVDVTYFVGAGFSNAEVNLINLAAEQWSAQSNVRLMQVSSQMGADIQLSYGPDNPDLATLNRNSPTLGAGLLKGAPWAPIQGPVTAEFNSDISWWTGLGPIGANQFDFETVALDVMGYSIGLGLLAPGTDPTSVMQTQFASGVVGPHAPSASDLASVQAIYGAPEPATLALFGVGLSLLGLSRRRPGRSGSGTAPGLRRPEPR